MPDLYFNGGPLLVPLLPGLAWTEARELLLVVAEQLQVKPAELAHDERDDVRGLPVARVKQMGQGVRREVGQALGAVQGVVYPLAAPPPLGH